MIKTKNKPTIDEAKNGGSWWDEEDYPQTILPKTHFFYSLFDKFNVSLIMLYYYYYFQHPRIFTKYHMLSIVNYDASK